MIAHRCIVCGKWYDLEEGQPGVNTQHGYCSDACIEVVFPKRPFEARLAEVAKQPDPPAAFRAGLVAAVLEDHPNADPAVIEQMISDAGG